MWKTTYGAMLARKLTSCVQHVFLQVALSQKNHFSVPSLQCSPVSIIISFCRNTFFSELHGCVKFNYRGIHRHLYFAKISQILQSILHKPYIAKKLIKIPCYDAIKYIYDWSLPKNRIVFCTYYRCLNIIQTYYSDNWILFRQRYYELS